MHYEFNIILKEFSVCFLICKLYYPNRKTWPRLPWIYSILRVQVMPEGSAHWNSQLDFILHLHRVLCLGNVIKQIIRHAMQGKQIKTKPKQTKPSRAEANKRDKCNSRPIRCNPCSPFYPWWHYWFGISFCIVCIARFDFISSAAVEHVSYAVYWIITKN